MQAFLFNAAYRTVLDTALQAPYLERHFPIGIHIGIVFQPVEIALDIVDRVNNRSWKIIVEYYLLQYILGFKTLAVGFQIQLIAA